MKTNFHTHTSRCHHAIDTDEAYVQQAIAGGYQQLGFSDHGPLPYDDEFTSGIRMDVQGLDDYLHSLRSLRDAYADSLVLRIGLEYEYFPTHMTWIADVAAQHGLDYLILGNHWDQDERTGMHFSACRTREHVNLYVKRTIVGMESGIFACLAHPDLFLYAYPAFDAAARDASRVLCRAALALDMPLEYNLLGITKQRAGNTGLGYPCAAFWEIAAAEGCTAIIGVDAHSASALLTPEYEIARSFLARMDIQRITTLEHLTK